VTLTTMTTAARTTTSPMMTNFFMLRSFLSAAQFGRRGIRLKDTK
jgi:hypothetical protein